MLLSLATAETTFCRGLFAGGFFLEPFLKKGFQTSKKLSEYKRKRDCMLFPDTENARSLFSLPLDLYFHLREIFSKPYFVVHCNI